MDDALHKRGQTMEDLFFQNRDRELLEKLRKSVAGKDIRSALTNACGISDEKVLDAIVNLGITAESIVALTMIPLVTVAWADGTVQPHEKEAILSSATENGLKAGSVASELLNNWLSNRPSEALLTAWKQYMHALHETLTEPAFNQMKNAILLHCEEVARKAGGILGIATVSSSEKRVIEDLRNAIQ